ncbi:MULTISPECIES: hypothetical protein [Rhizobium/Agrobacterium group]|uniref:hypothetical protein n=1 Tax=Rhizobium oryzihabitans TaxID=2267833 RepID=UPI004033F096
MADSKIDDGGPAFSGGLFEPQHGGTNDREPWNAGMSLRDWFAGQCVGAALSMVERAPMEQYKTMAAKRGLKVEKGVMSQLAAIMSYEIADAMIAARKAGA